MAKEYKVKVLKNGERRYIFDVNIGYRADGTRIRTTISAKTIKDGREQVAQFTLGKKKVTSKQSLLFKEAYKLYEKHYSNEADLSEVTIAVKKSKKKQFVYFDEIKLNKIKKTDIEHWKKQLKLQNISVYSYENELASFFKWCIENELIESSPMKGVKREKRKKTVMNIWTEKEFFQFREHLRTDNYKLLFTTLFYTGLRISEALGLHYEDVKDNELHLSHTYIYPQGSGGGYLTTEFKTPKSKRIVPIPEWLDFGGGTGRIFNYSHQAVREMKKTTCERANMKPIRIHDFRHSYVSMLINKGVDIYTIKELLGHENITTTMDIYGHLYDSKRKEISKLF